MILVVSASSPLAGVAFIDPISENQLVWEGSSETSRNASGELCSLVEAGLASIQSSMKQITGVVADVGPGSFIGSRVGTTFAKTLAYALGIEAAGVLSFDLIDPAGVAVVPSRKGEFFVRMPGQDAYVFTELPNEFSGYGTGIETPVFPSPGKAVALLDRLHFDSPFKLVPTYLLEPSISVPRVPFPQRGGN